MKGVRMEQYKKNLIDISLDCGALSFGEFEALSGRKTPYFNDTGKISDGKSSSELGRTCARFVKENFNGKDYDVIFGPAYKGIKLAELTAVYLNDMFGINKRYVHDRKEPKKYGEATGAKKLAEMHLIGDLRDGDRVLFFDNVITDGRTKYKSIDLLNSCAKDLEFVCLLVLLDRQEVGKAGKSAVEEFTEKTGIPVVSMFKLTKTVEYMHSKGKINKSERNKVRSYLEIYGTKEAKEAIMNW